MNHKVIAFLRLSLGALLICIYAAGLMTVKDHIYTGWTWKGFLTDYKALLTLIAFLSPPISGIWAIYR